VVSKLLPVLGGPLVVRRTHVSAMLVATTIFRTPHGGRSNTLCWSCAESDECSGSTWTAEHPIAALSEHGGQSWTMGRAAIDADPAAIDVAHDWRAIQLLDQCLDLTQA
jgi:hypothetical protein